MWRMIHHEIIKKKKKFRSFRLSAKSLYILAYIYIYALMYLLNKRHVQQ